MRRVAIAVMMTMISWHGAHAAFIRNYADWHALSEEGRVIYTYALVDRSLNDSFKGEQTFLTA